jgi:hypothetical protein
MDDHWEADSADGCVPVMLLYDMLVQIAHTPGLSAISNLAAIACSTRIHEPSKVGQGFRGSAQDGWGVAT